MNTKQTYILNEAKRLSLLGQKMKVMDLAIELNRLGFRTGYGSLYQGQRGTYTLLHATYKAVKKQINKTQADLIALHFTKPNGAFAWK